MWCLTKEYQDKFLKGLTSGEINPDKLVSMKTAEREAYLAKFVGEWNAKFVNTEFESKLLLKNQKQGIINWAKRASGMKPQARADIITKLNKLNRAIDPNAAEGEQFLSDIAERRLGVSITEAEGQVITGFTDQINSLFDKTKEPWEQSRSYWQARQGLVKYLREIKPEAKSGSKIGQVATDSLSIFRAIKTGFDDSALGRQGRVYMGTKEWTHAAINSFQYAFSKTALDNLEVDIMSHRYADQLMKVKNQLGLTLLGEKFTAREEQYAAKVLDKIPGLKQSEGAYVGFLNDLRFNRFVNILESLEKSGHDISSDVETMKSLAQVIGSATGRGSLGSWEMAAKNLSTVLFSPRYYASRFQILADPFTKSGPARAEAAKNLMRLAGTQMAIMGLTAAAGGQIEKDPRSADFLKVIIGNTRFDTTGGVAAFLTLLARTGTFSSKSSTTGKVTSLNSDKYGSQTLLDVWISFLTNRASPVAAVVRDIAQGHDFNGKPVEVSPTSLKKNVDFTKYLVSQLIEPLFALDAINAFNDAAAGAITGPLSIPSSFLGVGVNTYKK